MLVFKQNPLGGVKKAQYFNDMKTTTSLLFTLFLLAANCSSIFAQNLMKQANEYFERYEYTNAADLYQQILKKDKNNAEALEKIAECYRLTSSYHKAEGAYKKAVKYNPDKPVLQFRYGQALMANRKYEEAAAVFKKYSELVPYDSRGWQFTQSCQNIKKLQLDSGQYNITLLPFNSKGSDFSPSFFNDGLVFASSRNLSAFEQKDGWTGEAFLDLYYTEPQAEGWTEPVVLPGKTNTPAHEGPATFNKFGTLMYFTRSATKGESKKSGTVNLKLYQAKWVNGKWTDVDELPFNSNDYSVGHPALSPDGKTLYFTSDMPNGYGGKDLYKSEYKNGQWTEPQNLGRSINTEGDEMFPTVQSDGTLYFSSDGQGGVGGLDIFVAVNQNGAWIVDNAGYPINSSMDDFGLILRPDKQQGYFSSNRPGSRKDDVYQVVINAKKAGQILSTQSNPQPVAPQSEEENGSMKVNLNQPVLPIGNNNLYIESKPDNLPDPANNSQTALPKWEPPATATQPDSATLQNTPYILIGHVVDFATNRPLSGMRVELKDLMSNDVYKANADDKGLFQFNLEPEKHYEVYVINNNGQPEENKFIGTGNTKSGEYLQVLLTPKSKTTGNQKNPADTIGIYGNEEPPLPPPTGSIGEPPTIDPLIELPVNIDDASYTFRVQFGSFKNEPNQHSRFTTNMPPNSTTEPGPNGFTRYVSRSFNTLEEVEKYRYELISKGYTKKSFIVLYINGVRYEGDAKEYLSTH
ncbi:hypothetical protein C7N43_29885 [Sphingobacteriales bacterium UPWRP_1]|nr:hypothetical protein B6N25_13075 [Sphingobacteriales bacterium TSM_CSS]PSJ73283.1 hypothetical protein C7N43_29885 [Sphingobacteriales bacterium UPWRP_1]